MTAKKKDKGGAGRGHELPERERPMTLVELADAVRIPRHVIEEHVMQQLFSGKPPPTRR